VDKLLPKNDLSRMTWVEAKEALTQDPVVLLPVGTLEQNGPHCPLGTDTYIADYFSREVARHTDSLVMPAIPYGCSQAFDNFAGTVWLTSGTLQAVVRDIVGALAYHGCRRFMVVNNHGPNQYPAEQAVRDIMQVAKMRVISVWPSQVLHRLAAEMYRDEQNLLGHGGEPMTSVMMALRKEDVRTDLIPDAEQKLSPVGNLQVINSTQSSFRDQPIQFYLDVKEVSDTGQTGDARRASAQKGKVLLDQVIAWGIELVREFKRMEVK
jgi:creatinine amidohydrolase